MGRDHSGDPEVDAILLKCHLKEISDRERTGFT
jgi:hypothetical protein